MADEHSNCGNCIFFKASEIIGLCRLYPQHQNKSQNDWCGQYQEKEITMMDSSYDILTDQIMPAKRKYTRRANA